MENFNMNKRSQDLLAKVGVRTSLKSSVTGISLDSRRVEPGDLFVAVPCCDVIQHIREARERGAKVIVTNSSSPYAEAQNSSTSQTPFVGLENEPALDTGTSQTEFCVVEDVDMRQIAAKLCAAFYNPPPQHLVTVTGTNGKSSTVTWARQWTALMGDCAASMGTLGVCISRGHSPKTNDHSPGGSASTHRPPGHHPPDAHSDLWEETLPAPDMTTYDPVDLNKILHQIEEKGVPFVALEATSHGLDQRRLDGLQFEAAALTNITQDHLDYHRTMEAYAKAKLRLFTDLVAPNGTAILNRDSAFFDDFFAACQARSLRILTYGVDPHADFQILSENVTSQGMRLDLRLQEQVFRDVLFPQLGSFQVENLLAALGLCMAISPKFSYAEWLEKVPELKAVPGRMERVATHNGASIFVDFCHTPDALKRVLTDLKNIPHRHLWVVFGCGGERDANKRPQMGEIAASLADHIFVTDDNPRGEDPAKIRAKICRNNPRLENVPGRDYAIRRAIAELSKDDILLVAGRGHESFQKIQGQRIAFHDGTFVRDVLGLKNTRLA